MVARTLPHAAPASLGAASFCGIARALAARARAALALLGALASGAPGCLPPPGSELPLISHSPDHVVAPAPVELGGVKREPGFAKVSLEVAGHGARELVIWWPEADGPRPLAIFLHGAGGGKRLLGSRGILPCLVKPALEPVQPILVAPVSASSGQWWTEADISFVLGLVDAARKSWPVAPEQTLLLGYSNGGIGTWFFVRQYPDRFSAAIPMAADGSIVGATPVPVYAISGDKDELFPIVEVRRAIAAARAAGQNVTLHERHRGTHMKACSYVPDLEAAGEWFMMTVSENATGSREGEKK